jgi:hypothetical protein
LQCWPRKAAAIGGRLKQTALELITCKDVFYLIVGVVIGLMAGVAIYWLPLGQFCNEWKALWNLAYRRFNQGDVVKIRSGTQLESTPATYGYTVTPENRFLVWHDEGVGWFHTGFGWKRARILRVFLQAQENIIYKVSHFDLEEL